MSSKRASASGSQVPRLRVAPPADSTYGDVASDFAGRFGLAPDAWQRLILDDWLARKGQKWAARNCGLAVPRQNGKNAALEMRELFGAVMLGEAILHTAHEVKTAKKHFRRLQHFFGTQRNDPRAKYPELNALVAEIRKVNGEEAIILTTGGSIEMAARSKNSGRGFTVDIVIFDEAQQLDDDALEALLPTKSAAPSGNPQTIYTGTPPGPNAQGEVFTRQRAAAVAKGAKGRVWHEWSLAGRLGTGPGEVDLDNRANWFLTNPALGGRLHVDTVLDDRGDLSDGGFARERLGMWADDDPDIARVVADDLWRALRPEKAPAQDAPPAAIAVDMSPDRIIAISAAWADGDRTHVELLATDAVDDPLDAVDFVADRAGRRIKVYIDGNSPAAAMVPALQARKVKVQVTGANDMGRACGLFYDDAMAGRLTHAGQDLLNKALAGAKKRNIGTAGAWGWDRRDIETNLAPLVSVTLARFGAAAGAKRRDRSGSSYQRQ